MKVTPLKAWLVEQGQRAGISGHSFYWSMKRGRRRWPKLFRLNKRVVFVIEQ
jgi:hypothetical protein